MTNILCPFLGSLLGDSVESVQPVPLRVQLTCIDDGRNSCGSLGQYCSTCCPCLRCPLCIVWQITRFCSLMIVVAKLKHSEQMFAQNSALDNHDVVFLSIKNCNAMPNSFTYVHNSLCSCVDLDFQLFVQVAYYSRPFQSLPYGLVSGIVGFQAQSSDYDRSCVIYSTYYRMLCQLRLDSGMRVFLYHEVCLVLGRRGASVLKRVHVTLSTLLRHDFLHCKNTSIQSSGRSLVFLLRSWRRRHLLFWPCPHVYSAKI